MSLRSSLSGLLFPSISERAVTVATLALILVGCALRLAWALHGHMHPTNSEAHFIAKALAEGRGFSDAFGPGAGPTAHLMPLTPLPAALAYAVFGAGSQAAELALTIWALSALAAALVLAELVLRELGAPALPRLGAVAFVAILPIQYAVEADAFRVWEGGLAAAAGLAVLLATLHLDRRASIGRSALATVGLANGAVFLISPPAALGTSCVVGLLLLRRVSWRLWCLPILSAAILVAVVLVPWGLRNERVLGDFVALRTGGGMSLALSYYDGRSDSADVQTTNFRRFKQVSPLMGEAARQRYMQLGEVAYNRELARQASVWMAGHKAEVMQIRLRNFVEFYAPPVWHWTRFTTSPGSFIELRRGLVLLTTVIAAITVTIAMARGRQRWFYVVAALLAPSLPYITTYPVLRYHYLVSTLLIFVAAAGVWQLLAALVNPPRSAPEGSA